MARCFSLRILPRDSAEKGEEMTLMITLAFYALAVGFGLTMGFLYAILVWSTLNQIFDTIRGFFKK